MTSATEDRPGKDDGRQSTWSKQDREDLDAINASIDRMRDHTPADPFVLTIPQDVEPRYHHSYAFQGRQWLEHTPFDPREHESSQYQTFVFHEQGRDMYVLHSSRPPESDAGVSGDGGREKAAPGTGANTPSAGPKKKMSLNAYKKKQTGATPEISASKETEQVPKKPAVKGPVERLKADEEVLAAVEKDDEIVLPPSGGDKKELKRKREDSVAKKSIPDKVQDQHDSPAEQEQEPAAKRLRKASDSQTGTHDNNDTQPMQPSDTPKVIAPQTLQETEESALPPKLSPPPTASEDTRLPPKLSPVETPAAPAMPRRLSPTIPANINETLKARAHFRSSSHSSDISRTAKDGKLTPPNPDVASIKRVSPARSVPRNGFRANSSSPAVRSDAEETRGRALTSVPPKIRTPEIQSEDSDEIAVAKIKRSSGIEKPRSLMVRLKIKKAQREAVRRILKMRPNPEKRPASQPSLVDDGKQISKTSDQRHRERRDTNAKGVAQKIGPLNAGNGTRKNADKETRGISPPKRSRDEDTEPDEPPAKRKRPTTDANESRKNEPSTPTQPDLLSPSSAQKTMSQQLTPSTMRKDLLSVAMKREQSTDSTINTPMAMSQSSPGVNGTQPNGVGKPASSQPSNKTPKQAAWESEQKRLEVLGRDLKHAAQAHVKSASQGLPDAQPNSQKLAAIKSLESLLAYILAFTCSDEAAMAADPKRISSITPWKTLHGFFGFVKRSCEPFPVLLGLACWLGVVFNAHILQLTTLHQGEGPARDGTLESQAMMLRAAHDAEVRLDIDTLQASFPKAWEGRAKGLLSADGDKLQPEKGFKGPYKLPLGIQTQPLRAARAGYAMLEEWIAAQEGLEYGLRLKL